MGVIVRDDGFHDDDMEGETAIVIPSDTRPQALPDCTGAGFVIVEFPTFGDGRGFTLARRLRAAGFAGRLRARGRLIADQYAMARRVGFDEVEIADETAERQPAAQWIYRADWQDHDYRSHLRD